MPPFSRRGATAMLTGMALSASPLLNAQTDQPKSLLPDAPENLEASVAGGIRFEDNLVVDSLDLSASKSDIAAVTKLDLTYKDTAGKDTDLRTGYLLEDRRYAEEQDFNLQLHYGYLDLSRDWSGITVGTTLDLSYARIGGESLLNKQKISGYVSDLVMPRLYVRSGVALQRTGFDRSRERDSRGQGLDASGFYFLDGTRQYLTTKARFELRNADGNLFDYQSYRISLGYVRRFSLGTGGDVGAGWPLRLRADWRYEQRQYDGFDPALGARREDDRNRWRLRLDAPIHEAVTLEMKLEHRRYDSNNPALDFNDNRIELLLELALI